MSGVWVFKDGVVRLVDNVSDHRGGPSSAGAPRRRKVLLYTPTNEVVTSYASLEHMLAGLGWERYREDHPELLQYHRQHSLDLISLPRDFGRFRTVHMYDIVVKNRHHFRVVDA